jgi:hypothetical protein
MDDAELKALEAEIMGMEDEKPSKNQSNNQTAVEGIEQRQTSLY